VEKFLEKDEIARLARNNLVEGENWHKKVNVREIVFGFNDGSISILALLAGVTRVRRRVQSDLVYSTSFTK